MKTLAVSDHFGTAPHYYHAASGRHGVCLSTVVGERPQLNTDGIRRFLHNDLDGTSTIFCGVRKLPAGHELIADNTGILSTRPRSPEATTSAPLQQALPAALADALRGQAPIGLALGGGLDSALLLALVQSLDVPVSVYTLATDFPGYCERTICQKVAVHFGVNLRVIEANEADFIAAVPATIAAAGVPLYNLHPVSKHLLAQGMFRDGMRCILTGDGADQACAGTTAEDYLPVVGAIIRASGLHYVSPFFDDHVIQAATARGADHHKSALRAVAASYLPASWAQAPKIPRLAPPMDLGQYQDPQMLTMIYEQTGITPELKTAEQRTLWATLSLLIKTVEVPVCVA